MNKIDSITEQPAYKKAKLDNIITNMSNYNQNQNRFKFTVKQNNNNYPTTSTNNTTNKPQQFQNNYNNNKNYSSGNQQWAQSQQRSTNAYNQSNNYQNSYNNYKINNKPEEILIDDKEDDDLLDISDTELIRASQVVESQLKFTNNVHHTTSNALNIFSQFNSNNNFNNNNNDYGLMGPPASTTIYSNSNLNNDHFSQLDDVKAELKQLKSENMQKDGEVKILRDKLKRLEQEAQKMRAEKVDLVKKLQQQQDEAKKTLQKQIEFKELENQFKAQEIVELTMKYKVLESTVKKNPNSAVILSSTPSTSLNQSQQFDEFSLMTKKPIQQQKLQQNPQQQQQSKTLPTKRPNNMHSSASLSDNENDNPTLDIKRPLLSSNNSNLRPTTNIRPPLSPYSNNSPIIPPQTCNNSKSINTSINKLPSKSDPFLKPIRPVSYRRACVLNTKNQIEKSVQQEIKFYKITDNFAETANFVFRFNNSTKQIETCKITNLNVSNLNKKLLELNEFLKENLTKICKNSPDLQVNTERVEFVSTRLNDELLKLIEFCLKTSCNDFEDTNLAKLDANNLENNSKPANYRSFIDLLGMAFEICFHLFLFRCNFLLWQFSIDTKLKTLRNSQTYDKLIKLKEKFFVLITQLLESINFSPFNSINSKTKVDNSSRSNFSSYSTLKIFNSILDCFNYLLYLPNLNQTIEPYSLYTCFYSSLADNVHTIFRNLKIVNLNSKEDPGEFICTDNNSKDDEDEDDHCLFQLFYEKLIKYFGDIVYALEPNECAKSNEEVNQSNDPSQANQQMEIITTIAAEDSKKVDFKLDNRPDEPINEFHNDILLSQVDLNTTANKNEPNNPPFVSTNPTFTVETKPQVTSNNCLDSLNINLIQKLKIEFITKFIYFLHNYQFNQSLEVKLLNRSFQIRKQTKDLEKDVDNVTGDKISDLNDDDLVNNSNKKRKIYESMTNLNKINSDSCLLNINFVTNNQKCSCFRDMLNSFLILIDYQFSEKFMFNGARLNFEHYFLKTSASSSSYLFYNQINENLIDYIEENLDLKQGSFKGTKNNFSSVPRLIEDFIKSDKFISNESENQNQFMYLLILISFNAFVSLFNCDKYNKPDEVVGSEFMKQKLAYLESIRDDFRFKSFFCLYKLAEQSYEDSKLKSESDEIMETNESPKTTGPDRLVDHLKFSLGSLRSLFKLYIDEYFDFS